MIPVDLLTDRTLYPIDRILGALLAQHDNGAYCCWPTNAQLAAEVGCRERQVQLSLRRLEAAGWIAMEPSHQVRRGQIIRLLWRRPQTAVRGAHHSAGGGAPRSRGGAHGGAPPLSIRPSNETKELKPARPEPRPEDDLLDAEGLAHWQALAAGGDRVQARIAGVVLKKHEQAKGALGLDGSGQVAGA